MTVELPEPIARDVVTLVNVKAKVAELINVPRQGLVLTDVQTPTALQIFMIEFIRQDSYVGGLLEELLLVRYRFRGSLEEATRQHEEAFDLLMDDLVSSTGMSWEQQRSKVNTKCLTTRRALRVAKLNFDRLDDLIKTVEARQRAVERTSMLLHKLTSLMEADKILRGA